MMDFKRYSSQIALPEVGLEGQKLIAEAKVLVVGAGGLGCPVLSYLVGMGVGIIGIIDDDVVKLENLHRQVLYNESDLGELKVLVAQKKLTTQNSAVKINAYTERLTDKNAVEIISNHDIVIDCSDNIETRYLIDNMTKKLQKPWVYGAVAKQEGQVAVINYKGGSCFNDLFPDASFFANQDSCSITGIMGYTTGLIGCLQVNEALQIILKSENSLNGFVLNIDLGTLVMRKLKIKVFNKEN